MLILPDNATSCPPISTEPEPNLLQAPVLVAAFMLCALFKRRCCENPLTRRSRSVWRLDMHRQFVSSITGLFVLIIFSRGLTGEDCVNFIGLVAVDLTFGCALDAALCWMMRQGGMRLGYYQNPPDKRVFAAQTIATVLISAAARSMSCCLASIVLNSTVTQLHVHYTDEMFYYVTCVVPAVYMALRFVMLDNIGTYRSGYTRIAAPRPPAPRPPAPGPPEPKAEAEAAETPASASGSASSVVITSPVHVIGDSEEDDPDTEHHL